MGRSVGFMSFLGVGRLGATRANVTERVSSPWEARRRLPAMGEASVGGVADWNPPRHAAGCETRSGLLAFKTPRRSGGLPITGLSARAVVTTCGRAGSTGGLDLFLQGSARAVDSHPSVARGNPFLFGEGVHLLLLNLHPL